MSLLAQVPVPTWLPPHTSPLLPAGVQSTLLATSGVARGDGLNLATVRADQAVWATLQHQGTPSSDDPVRPGGASVHAMLLWSTPPHNTYHINLDPRTTLQVHAKRGAPSGSGPERTAGG